MRKITIGEKMKVYLQYPWKFPDSPYYKYLLENPPEKIEYLNGMKASQGVITNYKKFWILTKIKIYIRKITNSLRLNLPNVWKTKTKTKFDLIHCAHCLSKNNLPWLADIESEWQFYVGRKDKKAIKTVKDILKNKNCKKILPWTEYTAKEIIKNYPEIKEKVEILYPAIPLHRKKKKDSEKIKILYATRHFWLKGGLISLEVYKRLKEKYNDKIELIFISDVPEEIKKKYSEIKIHNLIPTKDLFKLYQESSILFYPSFVDTFGFGILEGMSFGLPLVSVNTKHTKTRKEIIEDKKTGFVLEINDNVTEKILKEKENLIITKEEEKIIKTLFESCSKLIEDKKLREKMSQNCIEEIKNGKFSIKERNKKLKKIYEDAIK